MDEDEERRNFCHVLRSCELKNNMTEYNLTTKQISEYLDISDPFLMIDEIEEIDPGRYARAIKYLKPNDWFFDCHLPRSQSMPATLQIEGMLQTFVMMIYTTEGHKGNYSFVTSINARLISNVLPGNRLVFESNMITFKRGIANGNAVGRINGNIVCSGQFTYASPHLLTTPSSRSRGVEDAAQ